MVKHVTCLTMWKMNLLKRGNTVYSDIRKFPPTKELLKNISVNMYEDLLNTQIHTDSVFGCLPNLKQMSKKFSIF